MTTTLLLLFTLAVLSLIGQVIGQYSLKQSIVRGPANDQRIYLSPDGNKMVSAVNNYTLLISQLKNGEYEYFQSFDGGQAIVYVHMTSDKSIIFVGKYSCMQIYFWDESAGQYYLFQSISCYYISVSKVSDDGMFLFMAGMLGELKFYQFNSVAYNQIQNFYAPGMIIDMDITSSGNYFVIGGMFGARVYSKNQFNIFQAMETIANSSNFVWSVRITEQMGVVKAMIMGNFGQLRTFVYSGTAFALFDAFPYAYSPNLMFSTSDFNIVSLSGGSILQILKISNSTGFLEEYQNITLPSVPATLWMDDSGALVTVSQNGFTDVYFECQIQFCVDCHLIYICSVCSIGYAPGQDGLCYMASPSALPVNQTVPPVTQSGILVNVCNGQWFVEDYCSQYCDSSCTLCQNFVCQKCSQFYVMNEKSSCEIENFGLEIAIWVFYLISVVRHYKIKSLLLFFDDLWLYQYHQPEYTGVPSLIFQSARLLETKKDQLFGVQRIPFVQNIQNWLRRCDSMANKMIGLKLLKVIEVKDSMQLT